MLTVARQLRANGVALLSLVVALSSFSYTAWRTERSEANRTTRQAAFQLLVAIGQLQEVLYRAHYDHDTERGSPRSRWARPVAGRFCWKPGETTGRGSAHATRMPSRSTMHWVLAAPL